MKYFFLKNTKKEYKKSVLLFYLKYQDSSKTL